jgi:hypothetical protein
MGVPLCNFPSCSRLLMSGDMALRAAGCGGEAQPPPVSIRIVLMMCLSSPSFIRTQ